MGRSIQQALAMAKLVQPQAVSPPETVPVDPGPGGPWAGAPETAQWCAVMAEIVGEKRLIEILDRGADMTGAGRAYAEGAIEAAIERLPKRQADKVRERAGNGPWRGKGVPTWCADAHECLDCLRGGGHAAWRREQDALDRAAAAVQVPKPQDGETADAYDARLCEWEGEQVVAHLRHLGYNRYELVRAHREAEKVRAERAKAERAKAAAAPMLDILRTATDGATAARQIEEMYKALSDSDLAVAHELQPIVKKAAETSRWPWTMRALLNLGYVRPDMPPASAALSPEDAASLPDSYVLGALDIETAAITAEARKRFPHGPGQVFVLLGAGEDGRPVVIRDGITQRVEYNAAAPPKSGACPAEPAPGGWWGPKGWCGPELFRVVEALRAAKPGAVFIGVDSKFCRHPQKAYGRFLWEIKAGGGRDSFELPVDETIARRLDAVATLRAAGLDVPPAALWLDVDLGSTAAGRPKLVTARRATRAALVSVGATAMSQGRHGWMGSTAGASAAARGGDSEVLSSMHATSRGGGLSSARSVLWLVEGAAPVQTGDGSGLVFDEVQGCKRIAIAADPD